MELHYTKQRQTTVEKYESKSGLQKKKRLKKNKKTNKIFVFFFSVVANQKLFFEVFEKKNIFINLI